MKLRGAQKVHYDSGPNMTPLVDVVMVILIFLMLAGSFATAEHFMASNMPFKEEGAGNAKMPEGFIPDEPLEIRVSSPTPDRFIARAGQISVDNGAQLTAQLTKLRMSYEANDTPADKVQIVIQPGGSVKYKYLIEVYQAAMEAKFTKIAFAKAT
jgi:biopolymer transport protein ExbD